MNQPLQIIDAIAIHERSIKHLAAAWRAFAQLGGDTSDPSIQLLGFSEPRGYHPAFYVPSTRQLVVVITAAGYPTQESAWTTMWCLLAHLHQMGLIHLAANTEEQPA